MEAIRMITWSSMQRRRRSLWTVAGALLVLIGTACNGDGTAPTSHAAPSADTTASAPADTTASPGDTTPPAPAPGDTAGTVPPDSSSTSPSDSTADSTGTPPDSNGSGGSPVTTQPAGSLLPGIVFGSFEMQPEYFSSVHTGTVRAGGLSTTNILPLLSAARAKGARVVLRLCMGRDSYVKNTDGTFSLSKWKSLVARYKDVSLGSYINDGTILGHFLIDEPQRAEKWGGKPISQATIEEMARYSKQLWPGMATLVRVVPSWLASSSISYTYLDAAWTQYAYGKGEVGKWITSEVSAAKSRGLGLVMGMNVLDGGNGSSKIAGWTQGRYAMSASEIKSYGTTLLNQTYGCGFFLWTHDLDYYGRSDIKSAMADLSAKARAHTKTSCRQ
jgi:hypothetical protein